MNPWITAQDASGHVGITLSYALLIFVVRTPGRSSAIRSAVRGVILAAVLALDPHIFVLAVFLLVSMIAADWFGWTFDPLQQAREPTRDLLRARPSGAARARDAGALLLVTGVLAALSSAYWLLPDVMAARHLASIPSSVAASTSVVKTLTQLDDPFHLLGFRSFWWKQFSNGFYAHGVVGLLLDEALVMGVLGIVVLYALKIRGRQGAYLGLIWFAAPLILASWARLSPDSYSVLLRLPGGELLRDPNDALPIALVGLVLMIAQLSSLGSPSTRAMSMVAAALALSASVVPWYSGSLDGYLAPLPSVGEQFRTTQWINDHASRGASTLWLPADAYLSPTWAPGPVTDPVPYWTTTSVINPLEDPAYDFAPSTTLATEALEELLISGQELDHLGTLLASSGIQFVVVRSDTQPHAVASAYAEALRTSGGVRVASRFGLETIYEVTGHIRPLAERATGVTLFDGTWQGLAQAIDIDPGLRRVYVNEAGTAQSPLLIGRATTLITSDTAAAALQVGTSMVVPSNVPRQELVMGNEPMYAYQPGESLTLPASGLIALHVLGLNSNVKLLCNGNHVNSPAINQQPDVSNVRYASRWIGMQCTGLAEFRFFGTVWVGSLQTSSWASFERRLQNVEVLLNRPGSAYVLFADQFVQRPRQLALVSDAQDTIELSNADYRIGATCKGPCPHGWFALVRASDGLPMSPDVDSGGAELSLRAGETGYRIVVGGQLAGAIETVFVLRLGDLSALPRPLRANFTTITTAGKGGEVIVGGSPAPWEAESPAAITGPPVTADMYGSLILVRGRPRQLSLAYLSSSELAGLAISIASIATVLLWVICRRPWKTTKLKESGPGG
jgi:hypothetical protein